MADWGSILDALFAAKEGARDLKASKAGARALKRAAKAGAGSGPEAEASLQSFLSRGQGGFRLQGSRIVRAPAAAQQQQQAAAPVAAAEDGGKKKKKKRKQQLVKEAAAAQQQQQLEEAAAEQQQQANGAGGSKKAKKRKAGTATEPARPQDVQQAAAATEQHQQQQQQAEDGTAAEPPSGKRRKKGKGKGARHAAGGGGEGEGSGEGEEADGDGGGVLRITSQPVGGWEEGGDGLEELPSWRADIKRADVKSGPFSKAEKDTLRQAVYDYAAAHNLSTDDFSWLYASSKSGETKGVWKKIASKLPHRTAKSVWAAGTRIFHEGNYQGKWTAEEDAQLLSLVAERGRRWKDIGGAVGRMPEACRDRWLAIRLGDQRNSGQWSEEEVQRLQDAVNEYLATKAAAEGAAGGGGAPGEAVLRMSDLGGSAAAEAGEGEEEAAGGAAADRRIVLDDIDWNVVSAAVGTRSNTQCLEKWYNQLSPSMVARGDWGAGDDRRLLRALFASGAEHDFELDWGSLVRGRTATQARRRWRLMLKVVPDHRDKTFGEQVDELVERYMPQLKAKAAGRQQEQREEDGEEDEEEGGEEEDGQEEEEEEEDEEAEED